MVHPKVRSQLLRQLDITKQALSQRAKRIKKRFGPMTTDEAVYVIAHLEGIDLSKYLPLATVDRVRGLVPRSVTAFAIPARRGQRLKKPKLKVSSYPALKETLIREGFRIGTDIYPQLFVLENSIRNVISMRLSATGTDWWDRLVPSEVRSSVQRTMTKEGRYRHREPRGDHPLFYSNFDDLKKIVLANRTYFDDIIQDFEWFRIKMEETYMARNNIAHCVKVSDDDSNSLLRFQREWATLLGAAGVK